jgi:hypothetical protein
VVLLGPAFAVFPSNRDHERTSVDVDFDFVTMVKDRDVLLTTRDTEKHAKGNHGTNMKALMFATLKQSMATFERIENPRLDFQSVSTSRRYMFAFLDP